MPITIQAPEGVFSPQAEDELASHLTDAILNINGASDNPLARRHLIIPVSHMPADKLYAALYGDGFWGVGGKAYTDKELQQEL